MLYMVIFLISELYEKLTYIFGKKKRVSNITPHTLVNTGKVFNWNRNKRNKWIHEGLITESLPNGMFQVRFYNENRILGYVSGRI